MTTYAWPTSRAFTPRVFSWGAIDRTGYAESPYTGAVQTTEVPFAYRWRIEMTLPPTTTLADQAEREAFIAKIRRAHRVGVPHFGFARNGFAPRGTMRGTPTVAGAWPQGATALNATTTGAAGQTIAAGDILGITTAAGVQTVRVVAGNTAPANTLAITFEPPLRAAVSAGAAIVWDKPTVTCMLASAEWSAEYEPGIGREVALSFLEVWT